MSNFQWSPLSIQRLNTCHPILGILSDKALAASPFDLAILSGYRDKVEQDRLFAEKKTKLKFPDSKHNHLFSLAVDVVPYPVNWTDDQTRFYFMAGLFFGVFETIPNDEFDLRWGGDWNRNGDFKDQSFLDLPHFELIEKS